MSEVVVRMELPDCCDDCPMEYDGFMCRAIHKRFYPKKDGCYLDPLIDTSKERLPDCPIICQLPEGHGRLVDADANFLGVIHLSGGGFVNYNATIAERLGEEDMRMVKVIAPAERRET